MKRLYLSTLICLTGLSNLGAQCNYYQYSEGVLNSNAFSITGGSALTTDPANKIYFIASDGTVSAAWYTTSWNWAYLNASATKAKANTGLVYSSNKVYYINTGNQVCYIGWDGSNWSTYGVMCTSAPLAGTNSRLAVDEFSKVYYASSDGSIYNLYPSGSSWWYGMLNTSAPKSKLGAGLAYRNGQVFYVAASTNLIYRLYWNSGWNYAVLNSNMFTAHNSSPLSTDNAGKVYYVRSTGAVCALWPVGLSWDYNELSPNAVKSLAGTSIHFSEMQQGVYYFGTDNKMHLLYWTDCDWKETALNNNAPNVYANTGLVEDAYGKVYYISTDRLPRTMWSNIVTGTHPNIYVKGTKLMCQNSVFYPKVVNYSVNVNSDDGVNYWVSPTLHYGAIPYDFGRMCANSSACLTAIATHFQDIANKGFNTVRVCGLAIHANESQTDMNLYMPSVLTSCDANQNYCSWDDQQVLTSSRQTALFSMITQVCSIATAKGLKVILLTGFGNGWRYNIHSAYSTFLGNLAANFNNNNSIMAYDIFNEPSIQNYQGGNYLTNKYQNCVSSQSWYNSIRSGSSKHLVTIGLNDGSEDVLKFDPGIITADFISYHFYPFPAYTGEPVLTARSRVECDYRYVKNIMETINKPWIIGETGFSANDDTWIDQNDWGSENDQKGYAEFIIERTRNCGGAGYSWWEYHDEFNPGFFGLYTQGDPGVAKEVLVGQTFLNYNPSFTCSCPEPTNYYNYLNKGPWVINGTILDQATSQPIKNAVIWGFPENIKTFSKSDGTYQIYSNQPLTSLRMSAPKYECPSDDDTFSYTGNTANNGTTLLPKVTCQSGNRIMNETYVVPDEKVIGVINVFPNPSAGIMTIAYAVESDAVLFITDISGKKVCSYKLPASETSMNISCEKLENGIYLYYVVEGERGIKSDKLVIIK